MISDNTAAAASEVGEAQKSLPIAPPAEKGKKKKAEKKTNGKEVSAKKAKPAKSTKPTRKAVVGQGTLLYLDPRAIIVRAGWNPRIDYGAIAELANSIKAQGGIRRPLDVKKTGDNQYELIDGHRRLAAALKVGVTKVPALLSGAKDAKAEYIHAVIANDGKPLLPVEEANAYRKLLESGATKAEIAHATGRPIARIRHRLDLISAHPDVIQAVKDKKISVHLGVDIARANRGDKVTQSRLAKTASSGKKGRKIVAEELGKKDYDVIVNKQAVSLETRMRKLVEVVNDKDPEAKVKPELSRLMERFNNHKNYEIRLAFVAGGLFALGEVEAERSTRKKSVRNKAK